MSYIALVNSQLNNEAIDIMTNRGYKCISMPAANFLPFPMSTHPDMLVFVGFGKLFTHSKYYEKNKEIIDGVVCESKLSLIISDEYIAEKYPFDVLFNAALVGNKLICNPKYISKHILCEAESLGIIIVPVKQGYTKCSVCVVDDNSIITSDTGIYSFAKEHGIDSLLICSGNIALPPYEYGFIGGASGSDDKNVYFCGDIKAHPDCDRIYEFIESKNKSIVCLNKNLLFDSGSILFV